MQNAYQLFSCLAALWDHFEYNSYILTYIDRFTRRPEAQPISEITAKSIAQAFVYTWISLFRVPSSMTTYKDNNLSQHSGHHS